MRYKKREKKCQEKRRKINIKLINTLITISSQGSKNPLIKNNKLFIHCRIEII